MGNIIVNSLEKLDNNYVRIIGKMENYNVDVITNGSLTFNFSNYVEVKQIISFNGIDYIIACNILGETSLISMNENKVLIEKASHISYEGDGLFIVSVDPKESIFKPRRVFDLASNGYVPFPENMTFDSYKDGVIILQRNSEEDKPFEEMVIDRTGKTIIPLVEGSIRIIDSTKFIIHRKDKIDCVVDFNQRLLIQGADLILPINENNLLVLKNGELKILNDKFEVIKTYLIGETNKPWITSVSTDGCITMIFEKEYETGTKEHVSVIIDTETDSVVKADFIPSISSSEISIIFNNKHLMGLINKKGEVILEMKYRDIIALHDSMGKYFFVSKDDEHYIYNAESNQMIDVPYTEMQQFRDGIAIGFNRESVDYQLINEELMPLFNLKHIGHPLFYYDNGVLCYYSGNYLNYYDAYTIIDQSGEIFMPQKKCKVERNGFGLLEINSNGSSQTMFFDTVSKQFINIELNVPVMETEKGIKFDFRGIPIQISSINALHESFDTCDPSTEAKVKKIVLNPRKD